MDIICMECSLKRVFGITILVILFLAGGSQAAILTVDNRSGSEYARIQDAIQMPGKLEAKGTHFELTSSNYFNITFDSSEPVDLILESAPEMVTMHIENASGTSSTQITLRGFPPQTIFHKYEDNYHNHVTFTTDSNGYYSYAQDISKEHIIFIQPRASTKFINDSMTGGDCASFGIWNVSTRTCTLTSDLTETVQIDGNGIIFDGNGRTITGSGTGNGVYLSGRRDVTVKNFNIKRFYNGILLYSSSNNNITSNNNALNNGDGISLWSSSNNNTLNNNNVSKNDGGIYLYFSSRNTLNKNNLSNNEHYGIILSASNLNTLSNNNVLNNGRGYGIALAFDPGIPDSPSNNNTLSNNNVSNNNFTGIALFYSSNNILSNNIASKNNASGIILYDSSSNNTLSNNNASNNNYNGISLNSTSNGNMLSNNKASNNNNVGISISSSANNIIYHNNILNNQYQAYDDSGDNSWDFGYPIGGNSWSDYSGMDANIDNIGDTPYSISGGAGAQDRYPFMERDGWQKPLNIINSSSIVTNRTAIITWVTNHFADSVVKYGVSPGNYSFIKNLNDNVIFHSVTLTDLTPDTNYYFVVNSTDTAGSSQSQERSFWTPYDNFSGNLNITNIKIRQLTDYEDSASSSVRIGDKIFYASNKSGNLDIWAMDKNGSNKTRITNSTADEYPSGGWTSWENNSNTYKILYVMKTNGSSNIWVTNGDGTNKTQLTNDNYENLDPILVSVPLPVIFGMKPSGTIDNNAPAFKVSYYSYYGNISKVNLSVDGVDVTQNTDISISNLVYIPEVPLTMGKHNFTVIVETDKNMKKFGYQSFDIKYIYNTSPSCIVFADAPRISANISAGYGNILSVVMTLDGINVTSNSTIYPSYIEYIPEIALSNGSHSVFMEVKTTMGFTDNITWAFIVNKSAIPIFCGFGRGGGGSGSGETLRIMFASNRSGNLDIWMMNLDGSGLEQITSDTSDESSPVWIDSKLVYVSDKSGSKDIWSMDINGSNNKRLTNSVLNEDMPSSSYVGGIIYSSGIDGSHNLEAMNIDGTGKIKISNSSASSIKPAHSLMYYPWEEGIMYGSATKEGNSIYLMDFEEIGPKVKFWTLEEGYSLQSVSIDAKSEPARTWLELQRNGIALDDHVVSVGDSFFLMDKGRVILTAFLNRISGSENYYEVELVNVTQYSIINGTQLFSNKTKILANKIFLKESVVESTPTPVPTRNGGSSSGGSSNSGGGGGGAPSDEDFKNIEKQESRDVDIHAGKLIYKFTTQDIIKEIGFDAKTSEGLVTAKIELLKGRPKKATSDVPGSVYKYFNVVVGTSGYGSSSKLENAYVVFNVPDDWLRDNNADSVKVMKFKENAWIDLKTEKISPGTYKAYSPGFSGFAIVGTSAVSKERIILSSITPQTAKENSIQREEIKSSIDWFFIIVVFIVITAGAFFFLNKKEFMKK